MNLVSRTVIVFDTRDLDAESLFWARLLGGVVLKDETWHSLVDEAGKWVMGFQLNPSHMRPEWPNGQQQQQMHLDLHTNQPREMHERIINIGGTLLQATETFDAEEGFQVYADPAGHPFCVGWGHPNDDQIKEFARSR